MDDRYMGFYRGIVSNIDDPEKRGRIKCLIPDILGEKIESAWCEPCVPIAYDCGGDFCLPQVKETIWITFEKGNPNYPIYLGNWWQKNMTPLGSSYDDKGKIRIINFLDCTIIMGKGKIELCVGDNACNLFLTSEGATLLGNLTVDGDIFCENCTPSQETSTE